MKLTTGVLAVLVAGLTPACLGQGGCNEPVAGIYYFCDPPRGQVPIGLHVDRDVHFYPPLSGPMPVVTLSRAFAYATAIGLMDCDVVVSASGPNYFWGTWPVHIVASGGNGQMNTVIGGVGAGADAMGPPPVPVTGTSTNHDIDVRDFRGFIAEAHASVGAPPFGPEIAITHTSSAVYPEVTYSINDVDNHCDDTASWGWGAGAAIAQAWVQFQAAGATHLIVDDQVNISLPGLSDGRRVFIVPIPANGAPAAPIVIASAGQLFPGWTGTPSGGQLPLSRQSTVNLGAGTSLLSPMTIIGNDQQFDADCDGRFTSADLAVVKSWLGTDVASLPPASGSCPRNDDGTPNALAGGFDLDQDGKIGDVDLKVMAYVLDSLASIGQDAGLFGDVKRDGALNCSDLAEASSGWNTVLGDAGYMPVLDFDLNGTIDQYDQDQFYLIPAFATDFNRSGAIDSQDVFDFLNAWNASDPSADFDHNGTVNSEDLYLFLDAWFVGCS